MRKSDMDYLHYTASHQPNHVSYVASQLETYGFAQHTTPNASPLFPHLLDFLPPRVRKFATKLLSPNMELFGIPVLAFSAILIPTLYRKRIRQRLWDERGVLS